MQGRPGWRNHTLDRRGLRRAERKGDLVLLVLHHLGVAVLVVELNVGDQSIHLLPYTVIHRLYSRIAPRGNGAHIAAGREAQGIARPLIKGEFGQAALG